MTVFSGNEGHSKRVSLQELLELNESGTWGEEGDASDYPVLRSTNIHGGRLVLDDVAYRKVSTRDAQRYKLNDGDIIVTKSSGSPHLIGKSCLFTNPDGRTYLFSNFTQRLRARRDILDPRFLYFFLASPTAKDYLQKISNTTSGLRNLSMRDYGRQAVPLPPLSIQKQIAAILEKADAAREKRRQANQLTEQFLQSAFLEMFGDPGVNTRRLPAKRLADLVRKDDKVNYGVVQPGDDYPGGVPIVRISDFQGMRVDKTNLKQIDPKIEAAYKRSRLVGDELLLACVGSIGMVTLADPTLKGFNTVRAVARIRCGEDLDRLFLAFHLSTSFSQSFFSRETRTVSQPTLNIRQIEETRILAPPLKEQKKFAALVENVELLREKQRQSEKELENLFNSLMQRAFNGGLVR